jgi:hypothetical protein
MSIRILSLNFYWCLFYVLIVWWFPHKRALFLLIGPFLIFCSVFRSVKQHTDHTISAKWVINSPMSHYNTYHLLNSNMELSSFHNKQNLSKLYAGSHFKFGHKQLTKMPYHEIETLTCTFLLVMFALVNSGVNKGFIVYLLISWTCVDVYK